MLHLVLRYIKTTTIKIIHIYDININASFTGYASTSTQIAITCFFDKSNVRLDIEDNQYIIAATEEYNYCTYDKYVPGNSKINETNSHIVNKFDRFERSHSNYPCCIFNPFVSSSSNKVGKPNHNHQKYHYKFISNYKVNLNFKIFTQEDNIPAFYPYIIIDNNDYLDVNKVEFKISPDSFTVIIYFDNQRHNPIYTSINYEYNTIQGRD